MDQTLVVDTAGVRAMATRWSGGVGELNGTTAPAGLGLSCQASAAAVNAAHADVDAFTAGLIARVGARADGAIQADSSYAAQEAASATTLGDVLQPVMSG